jgi:hypothetical protein
MKSFALSALALVALSSASAAGESEEDWYTLDKELELLSANVAAQERPGPTVSAWLKTQYQNSSDIAVPPSGGDLSGFGFQVIRVLVDGSVGDSAEYRISIDGATGTMEVLDAYAHLNLATGLGLRVGQMKAEIMFTSIADRDKQILYERSYLGTIFNRRDLGAQLYGHWKAFDVYAGVFNGDDEQADELVFNVKGVVTFGGEIVRGQSGGYGVDALPRFSFGAAYVEDTTVDDANAVTLEFVGVSGPFWIGLEAAEFGNAFALGQPDQGILGVAGTTVPTVGDTTPWGATVGLGINDSNELAFRWDDTDNSSDDKIMTGGYTYYVEGHAAKVQVNFTRIDSSGPDTDLFTVGLTGSI